MNSKKNTLLVILFIACKGSITKTEDLTKADGPDMESPYNSMFIHSQNIYPDDNPTIRYFQPTDGSMHNGIYDQATQKAETNYHRYDHVIIINGTKQAPCVDSTGKYKDKTGNLLESIGIFTEYSENQGESQVFYLFGILSETKKNPIKESLLQNNNQPKIDFNSYSEE